MLIPDIKKLIWGVLFIVWSVMIFVFSIIPNDGLTKIGFDNSEFRWDYLEHLFVFILFAILYLQWRKADPLKKRLWGVCISGILLASLTELFQLFIQSRSFNFLDLLFNLAGLSIGALIINLIHQRQSSSAS